MSLPRVRKETKMKKTYAERLEAYLLDKEKRLQKKELKEQREKEQARLENEEELERFKREKERLTLEIIEKKKELYDLLKLEKKCNKRINRINNYYKLTIDVCNLIDYRHQLKQKIQDEPSNRFANNFQNIIENINQELKKKRTRLNYLRTVYS